MLFIYLAAEITPFVNKRGKVEKHISRRMNNRVRNEHSWGQSSSGTMTRKTSGGKAVEK